LYIGKDSLLMPIHVPPTIHTSAAVQKVNEQNTTTRPPLVSIIMPAYDCAGLIGETLESVRAQTLADWECLVIDDGSQDGTPNVVRDFVARDRRIKYFRQKNRRQASARNAGLKHACGDYIQFLDADDLIESHKLERQAAYLTEHSEVDIVYGGVRYFRTDDVPIPWDPLDPATPPQMPRVSGTGRQILEPLVRHNIMVVNSPLVRRKTTSVVGRFDERLPPAEDWDYWLRCALQGARFQFADLLDTLSLVRVHQISASQNRLPMLRAGVQIRHKLRGSIKQPELKLLNLELLVKDEMELFEAEAIAHNHFKAMCSFARRGLLEQELRRKMKWLLCAPFAPYRSKEAMDKMLARSVTNPFALWRRRRASK
jgi:glycosyltransferase involved in cell wall biosynthesis